MEKPSVREPDAERARRDGGDARQWRRWGPYLAERAWGSVREDTSVDGDAWASFPHDHARSRAYRWNEDGLAGWCDDQQHLCAALTLWNGVDPICKERLFGLTNGEGNHGEDVKEVWWYDDATPTASLATWRYHYPQRPFPYGDLITTNAARGRDDPEYELIDTGVFDDDRYWSVTVTWAKDSPDGVCWQIEATNAGPDRAELHVLPTLWFRNTWTPNPETSRPMIHVEPEAGDADGGGGHGVGSTSLVAEHVTFGSWRLRAADGPDGPPEVLACENETNAARFATSQTDQSPPFPKDGIENAVRTGSATVNPERTGTKAAFHHIVHAGPGETVTLRLRLAPDGDESVDLADGFDQVIVDRRSDADEFYADVLAGVDPDAAEVARRAFAGLVWSRQFYNYDVRCWLEGDPGFQVPPGERAAGRNAAWGHLNAHDVIAMPDPWEYPWFASWDLAFHAVATAHIDPDFAKSQLVLLEREWYQHPNGALPAYEWSFSDVNPPVQAWAARQIFETDGSRDTDFLERIFHKLLINFTWWVNRIDADGNGAFEGGFLGMDNIGAFNRSSGPPGGGELVQADGTAWMAMYCLDMLDLALTLAARDAVYEDVATKFLEHFALIAGAFDRQGLWDDVDGSFRDVVRPVDGSAAVPVKVRSIAGLVPLFAAVVTNHELLERLPAFMSHARWYLDNRPEGEFLRSWLEDHGPHHTALLSVLEAARLERVLAHMLDESELLSPHGVRSLSREHAESPARIQIGDWVGTVDYEPGESRTGLFGGNSNWRGPVWFPVNHLVITSLRTFHEHLGADFRVEHPTGSGVRKSLGEVADDLSSRLVGLFVDDASGRRPCFGDAARFQDDPAWHAPLFNEYFHGDTGAGLGASHQTGWTALVADLIVRSAAPRR